MPRTTGLGIKGNTTIGGVKHTGTVGGKATGGALAPSGTKALYPSGRASNPKVSSVSAIPAAKPKAGKTPNVVPLSSRTR